MPQSIGARHGEPCVFVLQNHVLPCRPKDPPTLQRFTAAMAQMSVGKESRAAQRHEAGIRARQQAQLAAIAREVAALDAGTGPDVD